MDDYAIRHSYNHIPYPRLAHVQTHPDRLAMVAGLIGMKPAPVERCRVLEIGCASGGNLLPMAYGLPDSTFVGIDNSDVQIDEATADADALALENVTFTPTDIRDVAADFGEFDYIIAHGVYSWIPPDARDALLRVCKQNLAPQGVAYVSYNTYPGWHMVKMAREMLLYHIRDLTDPVERSAEAEKFLEFVVNAIPDSYRSPHSDFLQIYLDNRLRHRSGNSPRHQTVMLHGELAGINDPVYFHQFAEHAARHGLQYVAEVNLPRIMQGNFSDETVAAVQEMTDDVIEREQYVDFLRNRTFRETLLCHDDVVLDRTLHAEQAQQYRVLSKAKPVALEGPQVNNIHKFRTHDGMTFSTNHPLTIAAFNALGDIVPRSVPFADLLQEASGRIDLKDPPESEVQTLALSLLQAFAYSFDLIEFRTSEPAFMLGVSERPVASLVARHEIKRGVVVTTMRHERAELKGLQPLILPMCDGEHDRSAMVDELVQMVKDGKLKMHIEGDYIEEDDRIRVTLARDVELALQWLTRAALLIG